MLRLIVLTVLSVFLIACGDQAQQKIVEPPRYVKTMVVQSSVQKQYRRIAGLLVPNQAAQLSFRVNGTLNRLNVDLGNRVNQNEILATLDPTRFELHVKLAQTHLLQSKASLKAKQSHYQKKSALLAKRSISDDIVEQAKAEYLSAKAQVEANTIKLKLARQDLRDTKLRAPFTGTIIKKFVNDHEEINNTQPIFTLYSVDGFKVELQVPDTFINDIKINDPVIVKVGSRRQKQFTGLISKMGRMTDQAHSYPVTVQLPHITQGLRAGMPAEITFEFVRYRTPSFLIPYTAILPGPSSLEVYAFLYNKETGKVHKRLLKVRNIQHNQVEVIDGLENGDILVTAGAQHLSEQQRVKRFSDSAKQ